MPIGHPDAHTAHLVITTHRGHVSYQLGPPINSMGSEPLCDPTNPQTPAEAIERIRHLVHTQYGVTGGEVIDA